MPVWLQWVLGILGGIVVYRLTIRSMILRRPELEDAVDAIKAHKLKKCDDLGMFKPDDDFPPRARIENPYVSILYWRTNREDGHLIETIDFIVTGKDGGMTITFEDNAVVKWTRNMFTHHSMEPDQNLLALHVLQQVRNVAL